LSHANSAHTEEATQPVVDRCRGRGSHSSYPSSQALHRYGSDVLDQHEARNEEIRLRWLDADVQEPQCF